MTKNATNKIASIKKNLSQQNLVNVAYKFFVKTTPIDTGNARARTSLSGNEIRASYPYAGRLDNGYSRQAPNGMTQPTIDYLTKYIRQQLGK